MWYQPCLRGIPSIIKSFCMLYVQSTQQWIESRYCPRSGDRHITQKLRDDYKAHVWALHGPAGGKQNTRQVHFSQMKIDIVHATEAFQERGTCGGKGQEPKNQCGKDTSAPSRRWQWMPEKRHSSKPLTGHLCFLPVAISWLLGSSSVFLWVFLMPIFVLFICMDMECVFACTYAFRMHLCVCGVGQRSASAVLVLRQGLCCELSAHWLPRLAGQWALGICLFLPLALTRVTGTQDPSQPFFF